MAYTTIDKPDDYFNTVLYSGTGSDQSVTGTGFTTDWLWIKERNGTDFHFVNDSVRGKGTNNHYLNIFPNATTAEVDQTTGVNAINSNGFDITYRGELNESGKNYVAWNWLAGGTASSNTDGSITSSVSANTDAGFSIVSYTGNGTGGATVGHGLATTPQVIIIKIRDDSVSSAWSVYHHKAFVSASNPNILYLNLSVGEQDDTNIHHTTTTFNSTVFSLGNYNGTNGSGDDIIAYCFAEKKGYSKFGSYTGNGSTNSSYIHLGFKPAWVMIKRTTSTVYNWMIFDNKRNTFNVLDNRLRANTSDAEQTNSTTHILDFVSNGFKIRSSNSAIGGGGDPYIYMAFAENPFVTSSGVPTCAR